MIFDWCSAQSETVSTLQEARGLRCFRGGVFDRLRFVENYKIKFDFVEMDHIAPQRSVGGQDQIVVLKVGSPFDSLAAGVTEDAQLRREPRCFLLPIEDQGPRNDYQRRSRV